MEREIDDSGHFLLAGAVLIGLGGFFAFTAVLVTYVIELDLGFISGESMLCVASLMMGVGWLLRRDGRAIARQTQQTLQRHAHTG